MSHTCDMLPGLRPQTPPLSPKLHPASKTAPMPSVSAWKDECVGCEHGCPYTVPAPSDSGAQTPTEAHPSPTPIACQESLVHISSPRISEATVPTWNSKFSTNNKTKAGRVKFQEEAKKKKYNICKATLCPTSLLNVTLLATHTMCFVSPQGWKLKTDAPSPPLPH